MAYTDDKKPGELPALTSLATDDVFVVGDTSDASEVAKSITKADLITDLTTSFAPALGADDNYVTDAEKVKLANLSGTNTGDVTVSDSSEIDLTLTGQQISAAIVAGSIDETKLDVSVNASLDLADSASQPGHTHTASNITDFDTEVSNNADVAANTSARHAAVTVSGTPDYITLVGQDIVRGQIDLATDVTGDLPFANIAEVATNRIIGRSTAGTGDIESLTGATVRDIIGLDTDDSPQFTAINLGHATDTTITRVSAGVIAVEGVNVSLAGHTHTLANITDVTASAAEVNVLDGIPATLTATELGYVDGVTSAIQTQLDGKLTKATNFKSKAVTIESPTASEDITLFFTDDAITVTQLNAVLVGTSTPSVTWTIRHSTDRSAAGNEVVTSGTTTTSTTTGSEVTSFNDATIPAGSWVWLETTAESGDTTLLNVSIEYTAD